MAAAASADAGSGKDQNNATRKTALLVGINAYTACSPLNGCVNDVAVMRRIFEEVFGFSCNVLLDQQATRERILQSLEQLIDATGPNDTFVFFYAGHGSQKRNAEKVGGFNETIVAYNGSKDAHILDDELQAILRRAKSLNIGLIFDSCHSGDVTRDRNYRAPRDVTGIRGIPCVEDDASELRRTSEPVTAYVQRDQRQGAAWLPQKGNYVALSSCRDRQSCAEERVCCEITGNVQQKHGILTYCIASVIWRIYNANPNALLSTTWRDLHREATHMQASTFGEILRAKNWEQDPQLEGFTEWQLFGDLYLPAARQSKVTDTGKDYVSLNVGKLHSVCADSRWEIFRPANSAITTTPLPVRGDGVSESTTFIDYADRLPELNNVSLSARCTANFFANPLTLCINDRPDRANEGSQGELKSWLRQCAYLTFAESERERADYAIRVTDSELELLANEDGLLRNLPNYTTPRFMQNLFLANVEKLAFATGIIRNPIEPKSTWGNLAERFDFRFFPSAENQPSDLQRVDLGRDEIPAFRIQNGTVYKVQFKNNHTRGVYLTIIWIDCKQCIRIMFPLHGGHSVAVHCGGGKTEPRLYTIAAAESDPVSADGNRHETLRVIVTSHPVEFTFLEQDGIAQYYNIEEPKAKRTVRFPIDTPDSAVDFNYLLCDIPIMITL